MASKKMGRPTQDPKPNKLNIRINDEDLQTLNDYCKRKNKTKPEGVRDGIKSLKEK